MNPRTVLPVPRWRSGAALWSLLLLYVTAIAFASSLPGGALPDWVRSNDSIAHALGYAGLGALVLVAARSSAPGIPRFPLVVLLILAVANLALLDELYQSFHPGRQATLADAAIDVVSASVAMMILLALGRLRR